MVQINADKEEAEAVRVKVEAEEAIAKEKVGGAVAGFLKKNFLPVPENTIEKTARAQRAYRVCVSVSVACILVELNVYMNNLSQSKKPHFRAEEVDIVVPNEAPN